MKQRTPEWMAARVGRLTGSNWGAALGLCPWRKPAEVIRAMVREYHGALPEFTGNIATEYGTAHEQEASLWFQRESGLDVAQCGFFELGEKYGASPDGITSDGGVLELKVPFRFRNNAAPQFQALADMPYYYAQVQAEILAAGKYHGWFAQYAPALGDPLSEEYRPPCGTIERVALDTVWQDNHMTQLHDFYEQYLIELDNPEHLKPLRVTIDDDQAVKMVRRIGEIDDAMNNLKSERNDLLNALIEVASGKNAEIDGRKLTRVERQGSIDYKKAIAELAPNADCEPYRREGGTSWRLT